MQCNVGKTARPVRVAVALAWIREQSVATMSENGLLFDAKRRMMTSTEISLSNHDR